MKFVITTTYENVDQDFMDWYYDRLTSQESHLPGAAEIVEELKACGYAAYASKHPTSDVVGTTEYQVIK